MRLGSVFKIIYMDSEAALAWEGGGWELRSNATNSEALTALEKWKEKLNQKPVISAAYRRDPE